jgi:hypothetical protein
MGLRSFQSFQFAGGGDAGGGDADGFHQLVRCSGAGETADRALDAAANVSLIRSLSSARRRALPSVTRPFACLCP